MKAPARRSLMKTQQQELLLQPPLQPPQLVPQQQKMMIRSMMLQRDKFLRAELVYVSYYALDAWLPAGDRTLGDLLQEKGVFTSREREETRSIVTGWRL